MRSGISCVVRPRPTSATPAFPAPIAAGGRVPVLGKLQFLAMGAGAWVLRLPAGFSVRTRVLVEFKRPGPWWSWRKWFRRCRVPDWEARPKGGSFGGVRRRGWSGVPTMRAYQRKRPRVSSSRRRLAAWLAMSSNGHKGWKDLRHALAARPWLSGSVQRKMFRRLGIAG